jgi:hypothetical protein
VRTDLSGVDLIAAERQRQIEQEGWTPAHDALHGSEDLAAAAACYAQPPVVRGQHGAPPWLWPWSEADWKPTPNERIRELTKAGALIAAEIDRLQNRGGR